MLRMKGNASNERITGVHQVQTPYVIDILHCTEVVSHLAMSFH